MFASSRHALLALCDVVENEGSHVSSLAFHLMCPEKVSKECLHPRDRCEVFYRHVGKKGDAEALKVLKGEQAAVIVVPLPWKVLWLLAGELGGFEKRAHV